MMISGDQEIGYCLIKPANDFQNSHTEQKSSENKSEGFQSELASLLSKYGINSVWTADTPMDVKQGILSLNQINLLFQHLPVDISYVDENELGAFYSDPKHRVFPRSKGVIGCDVKNCYPKNSVATVEEIIEKFRSGQKDRVEFWINKPSLFIYILYVAVRDQNGKFKGVLEMMQDCTHIRELQGSQTLLNWSEMTQDSPEVEVENLGPKAPEILALNEETRIAPQFDQYPKLKDYMVSKSDKFKMLNYPMFKIIKNKARVKDIIQHTGYSLDLLQNEFNKFPKIQKLKD